MKFVFVLVAISLLGGCASRQIAPTSLPGYNPQSAVSYEQLKQIELGLTNKDCRYIDQRVNFAEEQLRLKGLLYATPENLNDADREYNAVARIIIWSLRIGCNNTDRYTR
jgi:5-bromo-4-chloroindolyl phosphate hydrolysis protein